MKILILLRNRIYADYIGYCLKRQGHEVKILANGAEIIPLLLQEHWDIAVVGISVDYYNGLEILDKYRIYYEELKNKSKEKIFPKTKFYILSTIQNKKSIANAKLLGATNYFIVPQNTNELLTHITGTDLCDRSI